MCSGRRCCVADGDQVTLCLGGIASRISKAALGISIGILGGPELCSRALV